MIIKTLILTTLLTSEPTMIIAMPPSEETKLEARRKRGKGQRGRKRGGSGLR
jgi:hypothetical protein